VQLLRSKAPKILRLGPETTFKATTRAVTVDVVVADPHGNPITGLTKDG